MVNGVTEVTDHEMTESNRKVIQLFVEDMLIHGHLDIKDFGLNDPSTQLTTEALQMGVSTVKRVMADYNIDPQLLHMKPIDKGRL